MAGPFVKAADQRQSGQLSRGKAAPRQHAIPSGSGLLPELSQSPSVASAPCTSGHGKQRRSPGEPCHNPRHCACNVAQCCLHCNGVLGVQHARWIAETSCMHAIIKHRQQCSLVCHCTVYVCVTASPAMLVKQSDSQLQCQLCSASSLLVGICSMLCVLLLAAYY